MSSTIEFLSDARNYARQAAHFVEGVDYASFARDEMRKSAVCFCIVVVAEACNLGKQQLREAPGDIPWEQIKGMRNILLHTYWLIDYAIVFEVARDHASVLADRLDRLIETLS
jgi:uncharacterized protein with HEPN domain